MDLRIIYPNAETISIVVPSPRWEGTIDELAKITVPLGIPYVFTNVDDIPEDRTFRDAWECDFSSPDGYGEKQVD